jgi:RND family efflux transporter MFP subunit
LENLVGERMTKMIKTVLSILGVLFLFVLLSPAQERKTGEMPPAPVVVSEIRTGFVAPEAEFVGTVFFLEVSDVASEVNGRIEAVNFEEGQRLKKGHVLVRLNADLLEKTLKGTKASYEQALSDLEKARSDFQRIENLYQRQVVPEQVYDENRFKVKGLEKKAESLKAEVERLEIELQKKVIHAPFEGVVIKKFVDRGEWLSPGSIVATMARDEIVDIMVDVPEEVMKFIRTGTEVKVKAGGKETRGKIFALIPRGDIATRTFPIKVRMGNSLSLVEGMEARVSLPTGDRKRSLMVPRDAVINPFGQDVIFAIVDSKAALFPVKVIGYQGNMVGLEAEGLRHGMKVAIKGNERLQDGQSVTIIKGGK